MFKKTARLIPYELEKAFLSPAIRSIFAVFLICNIVLCFRSSMPSDTGRDLKQYRDAVYQIYLNDPDRFFSEYERIKKAEDERDFMSEEEPSSTYSGGKFYDITLFDDVYELINANDFYHERIRDVVSTSEEIKDSLEVRGERDTFVYRYEDKVASIYSFLDKNVTVKCDPVNGWDKYFDYRAEFFIVMLLSAVICIYICTSDRAAGFQPVAFACDCGRAPSLAAKFGAAMICAASVAAVFAISSFVTAGVACGGYSDPSNAVQVLTLNNGMADLELFPLKISLAGAAALGLLMKIIAAVIFTAAVFVLASALKSVFAGLAAGAALIAVSYFGFTGTGAIFSGAWKYISVYSVYDIGTFAGHYRAVDVFGGSVNLLWVLAAVFVLSITAAPLLSFAAYMLKTPPIKRRRGRISVRSARALGRKKKYGTSLLSAELYKQRAVIASFVLLILIKLFLSAEYYRPDVNEQQYDKIYRGYIDKIGGEYTPEKAMRLEREYKGCLETIELFDVAERDYWSGAISGEYFSKLYDSFVEASSKAKVLEDLIGRSEYLKELYETRGIRGSYIYDSGYYKLVSQGTDWLLILFVAVFSCRSYLCEFAKGRSGELADEMLRATPGGRGHLFGVKLSMCVGVTVLLWLLFRAADLYFFVSSCELPADMNALLLSMPRYGGSLLNFTVAGYLGLSAALSLFGTVLISVLCFSISALIRRPIPVYAVTAALLFLPYFATGSGAAAASYFDITALYDFERLYMMSPLSSQPPVYCFVALSASVLIAAAAAEAARRRICKAAKKF